MNVTRNEPDQTSSMALIKKIASTLALDSP